MKKKKKYSSVVINNKFILLIFSTVTFLAGFIVMVPVIMLFLNIESLKNASVTDFKNLKPNSIVKIDAVPLDDKLVKTTYKEIESVFYRVCYKEYYKSGNSLRVRRCRTEFGKYPLRFKSGNKTYSYKIDNLVPMILTEEDSTYLLNKSTGFYNLTIKKRFDSQDRTIRERYILPEEKVLIYGTLKNIDFDKATNTYNLTFVEPERFDFNKDPLAYIKSFFDNTLLIVSTKINIEDVQNEVFKKKAEKPLIIAILLFLITFIQLAIVFRIAKVSKKI